MKTSALTREEKLQGLKKTLDSQAEKKKNTMEEMKAELNAKIEELKKQNRELKSKYTNQDKFLKDVKVNMSKNSSETVEMQTTISTIHKFLSDHSYLVTNLSNELRSDKNYYQISKKFLEFKKAYDKILIGLKKKSSKASLLVHSSENVYETQARKKSVNKVSQYASKPIKPANRMSNGSVLSRNSSRKSIVLNTSTISKNSIKSKHSVASKTSFTSKKSGKSFNRGKSRNNDVNNLSFINGNIDKEEKQLNKLKADYKKLLYKTEGEMHTDPLIKVKVNFLAKEIQTRSKALIDLRKNQRQAFKNLFNMNGDD